MKMKSIALLIALALAAGAATGLELAQMVTVSGNPSGIYHAGDGSGRLFIVQQEGYIEIWDGTQILAPRFLDIQGRVDFSGEKGLLGLAFPPDFGDSQEFYVHYSDTTGGDTTISRFQVTADPNVADPTSEEIILSVDQPFSNHNGGQILFGPDGFLYIALGDGGSANDPLDSGQTLTTLLGKILRIDPSGGGTYTIPADNPFVGIPGEDEIWAWGLRNPWRFTFDRETGDMFIGDVGQDSWEEINFQPASSPGGDNYGWRLMEGSECFDPPVGCNDGTLVLPILEYEHTGFFGNCSVTGGYRYRGKDFPLFEGDYFYGDYCTGNIWAGEELAPGVWASELLIEESGVSITTFGEDEDGELYVADQNGTIYRMLDDRPFCNIRADQEVYVEGETVTLDPASLVNLGESNLTVRVQVGLVTPSQQLLRIVDRGADGSFVLTANTVLDFAPRALQTVDANTPKGTYEVVCRLVDPVSGQLFLELRDDFNIE